MGTTVAMKDRNELTRDGEPLHDRGIIEQPEDDELDEMELDPPVDETDDGPAPVLRTKPPGKRAESP